MIDTLDATSVYSIFYDINNDEQRRFLYKYLQKQLLNILNKYMRILSLVLTGPCDNNCIFDIPIYPTFYRSA